MKIGIPKAFQYFTYHYLWETFFKELGCEIVVSHDTTKETLKNGINYSIDESCLSSKIYIGHVYSLIGKCDYILVPRIGSFGVKENVCTKFQSAYDVVNNIFRDTDIKILDYNVDVNKKATEFKAFYNMGKKLNKKKIDILRAYYMAKQADKVYTKLEYEKQMELLKETNKLKILIVSHAYNIYDELIGKPITSYLESLDCIPIIANKVDKEEAKKKSKELSPTLPWTYNKELMGALGMYKKDVDGIILLTAFPCGPDSLVNEVIIRKNKDKPIINLILDGQDGSAGIETRLESFIDIIKIKKEHESNDKEG